VLIPAGLPLDSLSAPIIKPAARERRISMRKSICNPIFQFSNTMKKFTNTLLPINYIINNKCFIVKSKNLC
jgi:hypothetical protein